ncbi:uncharacterized protein ACR2FA_003136 [Aphomia sociella]
MFLETNKMAVTVWFVFVLFCIQQVFAIDCTKSMEEIKNCDECIRCGGIWCNKPKVKGNHQCSMTPADNWCPGQIEQLPTIPERKEDGKYLKPKYVQGTTKINVHNNIKFEYVTTSDSKANVSIVNSTQNTVKLYKDIPDCVNGQCTTEVQFTVETDFCSLNSGTHEYFEMNFHVDNGTEDAKMSFHVPCACECSKKVERYSENCNGNGDYSCGVCKCHEGWSGEYCDKEECNSARGDIPCKHPLRSEECSGNGKCGNCGCICDRNKEGSQYFDKENYCADLCLITYECDACLDKPAGRCPDCPSLVLKNYNESLMTETDEFHRNVWVKCEETVDDCLIHYAASKNALNDILVMRINSCDPVAAGVSQGLKVTLPVVLVAAALVCAAAGIAYMMLKNKPGPMPPTSAQYQELDGPKTRVEENPTYKSPTTSYNNPMWGAKV